VASKEKVRALVLIVLGGLIGIQMLLYGGDLLASRRPAYRLLRSDVVRGDGKEYRRAVRVERMNGNITTTVTFTDMATGGVGTAIYIEPDLPPDTSLKKLVRAVRAELGFPLRSPMDLPFMAISHPMKRGEKWKVRIVLHPNGFWVQGFGKRPKGATINDFPSWGNPWLNSAVHGDHSILYGERVQF